MRNYLKRIRGSLGLTQQNVAEKLDISLSYYNLIENGDRQKDMGLLMASKLSKALNVSIDYIVTEEKKLARDIA